MAVNICAKVVALGLLWLSGGAAPAQEQTPAGEKRNPVLSEIPKYLEVSAQVGTGGQPTDAGFRLLAGKGYKAIVNLRTPGEGADLAAEKRLAEELGLKYFNIPVVSSAPKEEQALEFLKLMEELQEERVFVYCAAANRVGGFMMIQRVVKEGMSLDKAEEEANRIGLRSEAMRQFARDFVERHKK